MSLNAESANDLDLLGELIAKALSAGADAADAVLFRSTSLGVSHRLGKPEDLDRSESRDLGLRAFVGRRPAMVSSTDLSAATLDRLAERVVAMAKAAPEDAYAGLAPRDRLANEVPDLDLDDGEAPTAEALYEVAGTCEASALAVPGVTNSEEAAAGWTRARVALATSEGFAGAYGGASHSFHASVVAGEGTGMERDYEFTSARHRADLDDPRVVGRRAGEQAVARLSPRKVETGPAPVVFDPRVSRGLLGHFAGAISGQAVARGTSFLKDALDTQVFAEGIRIVDDPRRPGGLASKPFDGEGVANGERVLIDAGRLTGWLPDSSSARQLGLETTGNASRGTSGPPSPSASNLYMAAGDPAPEDLMRDIESGFYVTELIGFGVNGVTGDYSRGASGFWIEKGEKTYAVSELTIAGNLREMFRALTPANDLEFRYGSNAPTLRIDGMTVAGT